MDFAYDTKLLIFNSWNIASISSAKRLNPIFKEISPLGWGFVEDPLQS